jgi:hypothetical protein
MNFPQVHVAGDTLDFEVSVPDYPSTDGWTLTYYLTPRFTSPTQAPISVAASANADGTYQVQRSPAQTAAWAAGAYGWARIVSKTGARQTLTGSEDQGEVLVRAIPRARRRARIRARTRAGCSSRSRPRSSPSPATR